MLGGLCGSGNTMRPVWIVALATRGATSPDAAASVAMLTTQMRNWILLLGRNCCDGGRLPVPPEGLLGGRRSCSRSAQ